MAFGNIQGQTHVNAQNIIGTLSSNQIPNLSASKITSGTLNVARVPNLSASKTTSGVFDPARIPDLDANKIQSGILSIENGGTGVTNYNELKQKLNISSGITCTLYKNVKSQIFDSTLIGVVVYANVRTPGNISANGYSVFIPKDNFTYSDEGLTMAGKIIAVAASSGEPISAQIAYMSYDDNKNTYTVGASGDPRTINILAFSQT